jgi:hypothetical protein
MVPLGEGVVVCGWEEADVTGHRLLVMLTSCVYCAQHCGSECRQSARSVSYLTWLLVGRGTRGEVQLRWWRTHDSISEKGAGCKPSMMLFWDIEIECRIKCRCTFTDNQP